jgi:hypothetical protein
MFLHGNTRAVCHLAHWRKLNYRADSQNCMGERTGKRVEPCIRRIYTNLTVILVGMRNKIVTKP